MRSPKSQLFCRGFRRRLPAQLEAGTVVNCVHTTKGDGGTSVLRKSLRRVKDSAVRDNDAFTGGICILSEISNGFLG